MGKAARRRALQRLLVGVVLATSVALPAAAAGGQAAGAGAATVAGGDARAEDPIAHDPTMVKEGDWYYVLITGDFETRTYIPIRRSRDLRHWETVGVVFTELPAWVLEAIGATPADAPRDAWAPELSYVNGRWALYYSVSRFGTNNSVIGLATTPTLDPDRPDYGWVDEGLVLRSTPGVDRFNAIDPDYVVDEQGRPWLAFGSFFSGIHMRALDPATGKLSTTDTTLYDLASRIAPNNEDNFLEGPSIVRHGDYYYLFLAFDFCCRGVHSDYRVMVGRSTSITGPYVDRAGVPLLQGGGTEVLRGYNEFVGTGGADVYQQGGRYYLVHHYYDANDEGVPKLSVRTLRWHGGWPSVSDPVNRSRDIGHGDAYVRIVHRSSGLVVENVGCGFEHADVALGTDVRSTCRQWQFDHRGNGASSLLNRFGNNVAEIGGCGDIDGQDVTQFGWLGSFFADNAWQRWRAVAADRGWATIESACPDRRVLHALDCGTTPGTDLVVWSRLDTACQQFRFEPVHDVLLGDPATHDLTLDVAGCRASNRNGGLVRFEKRSGRDCQEWRFTSTREGYYTVTNTVTGRALTAPRCRGTGPRCRTLRVLRPSSWNRAYRRWTLLPNNDGTWSMTNRRSGTTIAVELLIP